jgi:hypothetical protein
MRAPSPSRVLIVAHQTADRPELVTAVSRRAATGSCTFTLLVPARSHGVQLAGALDPGAREAEDRLEVAIPLRSQAAGEAVLGVVGAPEPLVAVQEVITSAREPDPAAA